MEDTQGQDPAPFRPRLGRGLSSLIGGGPQGEGEPTPVASGEYSPIDVEIISRNPYQPRKEFEPNALNELVESISVHGVIQPLLVRQIENGYQLIAGERRLIASRKAGLKTVPCRIVTMDDQQVTEVAIIENLQRSDLNDLEKASAFQGYIDKFQCSIEDLARKMGKDRSTISNLLRLLELPEFVKVALQAGKVSAGHCRALLPLDSESEQIAMCQRIQSEGLNVRQTEEMVRDKQLEADAGTVPFSKGEKAGKPSVSKHILSLQQQLRDLVGAKVEIKMKNREAGRMIIHFNSNDEFERVVQHLKKAS